MALIDDINASHEKADKCLEKMKIYAAEGDRAGFSQEVRDFILYRFLIKNEAGDKEDSLKVLSQLSLDTIFKLTDGNGLGGDVSLKCTGAGSLKEKIFLLEVVLQKRLGVKLDPAAVIEIDSVRRLADELYDASVSTTGQ